MDSRLVADSQHTDDFVSAPASPGRSRWLTAALMLVAVLLGALLVWLPPRMRTVALPSKLPLFDDAPQLRFAKSQIGESGPVSQITNVQIVDFDDDGRHDVLVCDAARNEVVCYFQQAAGKWKRQTLGAGLKAPAHATVADVDGDGDRDVVVSILGSVSPSDFLVGQVVLLENEGGKFSRHVLLDHVRRVADVQAGDLDGDGDLDLAVAVFGYARGEALWLENRGRRRFRDHQLLFRPGLIHVPVADLDGDGDLDIGAIVSQNEEELWAFENAGGGKFAPRRLWFTHNFDLGSAGLVACDLDRDGDQDFLLPVGDNLEELSQWPQPYHGCFWFENRGNWEFQPRRIGSFGGTYAAAPGDIDGDGDLDVALVSMTNDWSDPRHASVVWLENDGQQRFRTWRVDSRPVQLITVACGDLNNDGRADIVAGGLDLDASPDTRLPIRRVTAWMSKERP